MLTAKLMKSAYNSEAKMFKLNEDTPHRRVYLLNFMDALKCALSNFKQICMLLMEYTSIYREGIPDYAFIHIYTQTKVIR